jgi:CxxC motif-containing protein (DUF1111 family)
LVALSNSFPIAVGVFKPRPSAHFWLTSHALNLKVIFNYGNHLPMTSSSSAEPWRIIRYICREYSWLRQLAAFICGLLAVSCSDSAGDSGSHSANDIDASTTLQSALSPVDVPIRGVGSEWEAEFNAGDTLFDLIAREADGLGPLFTRQACSSCHSEALRGSGLVEKMVVVLADGLTPSTDQSSLPYGNTVHRFTAANATTPILPPKGANIRVTLRLGPPVIGRGYLEAISDSEITRTAAEQAALGGSIRGKVNWVAYSSETNPDKRFHDIKKGDMVVGRFGLKARIATLDDFVADALQFDMGLTSPLRPAEFPNPDGLLDDRRPGVDIAIDSVNHRANYTRLLAIPSRSLPRNNGATLFTQVQCGNCHVPSLHTRSDYPILALADIDAPVFTDLLLHNMGEELSDSLGGGDGQASPRDWRTAPLIGLKYLTTYLHDGRATTLRNAILMHDGTGSEAHESIELFQILTNADQDALLEFVTAL